MTAGEHSPPEATNRPGAPADAAGPATLRTSAVSGVIWQAVSFIGGKLLVLAATAVLARVLVPEDFGLVALALVVIAVLDVVADGGIAQALVFLPEERRRTDAALAGAVASSCLLTAAALLAAPGLAAFFGDPDVVPLLRVLSAALVLGAVASVPEALLRRRLQFRRSVAAGLVKAAVTGGVSVGLALAGAGAWSLVWGQLAGLVAVNIALWSLAGHRPDLRWWRLGWSDLRPLVRYGGAVAGSVLLSKAIFDIDYVVVGRALGTEALGFYTLAFRLPELAIISVFFVLSAVAFPVYSRAAADPARLRRGYLTALRVQALYGAAAGAGLAVLAPYVVLVVFGPQWRESAVPLAALSLYAAVRSLGAGANDVYKAMGRPGTALGLAALRLVLLLPVLVWATRYGIVGVAWAQVAAAAVFVVLMQGLAARVLGTSARHVLVALGPSLVAGAGVAAGAGAVRVLVGDAPVLGLLLGVPTGALCGLVALRVLAPRTLAEAALLLRRRGAG